jgi:hypothetical protein
MEFEFDKEIDALLRRTAKSETAFADINPKSVHIDADQISAFAENVLPERLKPKYTAHFAECDRCRTILANTIALGAEAEIKTVSAAEPVAAAASVPWHRKFFAFPQLAYALGALVVLFGGFFAFLVVRNAEEATGSVDVSQTYETQPRASGPNNEAETGLPASSALSNTAKAGNIASDTMMSNSSSTATANSAPSVSANSATRSSAANASGARSNSPLKDAPGTELNRAAEQNAARNQADAQTTDTAGSAAPRPVENEKPAPPPPSPAADKKTTAAQEAPKAEESAMSARNTTPTVGDDADAPKARLQKQKTTGAETRLISGKNFTRKDGVWYDASYNGQATTNVSRGSGDYQKLDAGLRSVAGTLSGPIVVVWKNKAYRIQ